MRIGGIIDISTKDIPNKSVMVMFTVGCNLNCGFCHNKFLLNRDIGKEMFVAEIIEKIRDNRLISGVSISGGEPTLQPDIFDLCKLIKSMDKYVSLDTNGTNPEIIENILPFIDRVALDLKAPLISERLTQITRVKTDENAISRSFHILNNQKDKDFEIRTTYVENLLTPEDIHQIILWLQNNNFRGTFVLQQYQYSDGVTENYKDKFQKPDHISLINILKPYSKLELPFRIFIRDDIVGYTSLNNAIKKLEEK